MNPRRRLILGTAILLGLLGMGLGAWIVQTRLNPASLRRDVLAEIRSRLPEGSAKIDCDDVRYALGSGLTVRNFVILSPDTGEEILRVGRVFVEIDLESLGYGGSVVRTVEIAGLRLNLHRRADASWLHGGLLEAFEKSGDSPALETLPVLRLIDAKIDYRDALNESAGPRRLELGPIDASVSGATTPDGVPSIRFSIEGKGKGLRHFSLFGSWLGDQGTLAISQFVVDARLEKIVPEALPRAVNQWSAGLEWRGRLGLSGAFTLRAGEAPSDLKLRATLSRGKLRVRPDGFFLGSVDAEASYQKGALTLERFRALLPSGSCDLRGNLALEITTQGLQPGAMSLEAKLPRIDIGPELMPRLPRAISRILEDNSIRGPLAVSASIEASVWPPRLADSQIRVNPQGVTVGFEQFPYPIDLDSGSLVFAKGKLESNLHGHAGAGRVDITGSLSLGDISLTDLLGGAAPTLKDVGFRAQIFGGTTSPELTAAMPPKVLAVYNSFDPTGHANASLDLSWKPDRPGLRILLTVEPTNARFRYRTFPVTIDHVEGKLEVDFYRRSVNIIGITGRHRRRQLRGSGVVGYASDQKLSLTIRCDDLTLTRDILEALPESIRAPLLESRASGETGLEVSITRDPENGKALIGVRLDLQKITVHPPTLPFPVVLDGGEIEFDGKDVHLRGLTSSGEPKFELDGTVRPDGEKTHISLKGSVKDFVSDNRILGLFDNDTREKVRLLRLRGTHNFLFETDFVHATHTEPPLPFSYRIHDIASRDVGIDVGVRLYEVSMGGEIRGQGRFPKEHELEGRIRVHKARFNRLEFTDADISFVYGKELDALNRDAGITALAQTDPEITAQFREQLTPDVLPRTLQIHLENANLYNGKARGFFYARFSESGEMRGYGTASEIDLALAATDIFEKEDIKTSGTSSGWVRFEGLAGSVGSYRGEGEIEVSGSKFGEIPLFSKTVDVVAKKKDQEVGFQNLTAKFSIDDSKFHAGPGDIKLASPSVHLNGQGTLDFYGVIQLTFVPRVLDFGFPVWDAIKRNVAVVEVTGTLENPEAKLAILNVVPVSVGKKKTERQRAKK